MYRLMLGSLGRGLSRYNPTLSRLPSLPLFSSFSSQVAYIVQLWRLVGAILTFGGTTIGFYLGSASPSAFASPRMKFGFYLVKLIGAIFLMIGSYLLLLERLNPGWDMFTVAGAIWESVRRGWSGLRSQGRNRGKRRQSWELDGVGIPKKEAPAVAAGAARIPIKAAA